MARRGGRVGFFLFTHGHDGDVGESSVSCGGCCGGRGASEKNEGMWFCLEIMWHAACC